MTDAIPQEARCQNVNGRETCRYCRDTGFVVASTRTPETGFLNGRPLPPVEGAALDEVAPCPFCELGYRVEFPSLEGNKAAIRPPWGPDGFWKGQPVSGLRPETDELSSRPLPPPETSRRLRELAGRFELRPVLLPDLPFPPDMLGSKDDPPAAAPEPPPGGEGGTAAATAGGLFP